jgi:hypothetical protein
MVCLVEQWDDCYASPRTPTQISKEAIIYVVLNSEQNPFASLRHEAVHLLRQAGVITAEKWAVQSKMARERWIDQYDIRALTTSRDNDGRGRAARLQVSEEVVSFLVARLYPCVGDDVRHSGS